MVKINLEHVGLINLPISWTDDTELYKKIAVTNNRIKLKIVATTKMIHSACNSKGKHKPPDNQDVDFLHCYM